LTKLYEEAHGPVELPWRETRHGWAGVPAKLGLVGVEIELPLLPKE
jgi:hypothetical protein